MGRTPSEFPAWYLNLQIAVLKQLPRPGDIDQFTAEGWIDNQASLKKHLAECLALPPKSAKAEEGKQFVPASPVVINWRGVYEKLGLLKELEGFLSPIAQTVTVPDQPVWTIPVLKDVTPNKVVNALRTLGVTVETFGNDLDKAASVNDRDPATGSYIISFKANVEADAENANQSADHRKSLGAKDITLLERLLLEFGYFLATGNHLDIENVTLCSGSRNSDGDVPDVYWRSGRCRLSVSWCGPDYREAGLRARAAVS